MPADPKSPADPKKPAPTLVDPEVPTDAPVLPRGAPAFILRRPVLPAAPGARDAPRPGPGPADTRRPGPAKLDRGGGDLRRRRTPNSRFRG